MSMIVSITMNKSNSALHKKKLSRGRHLMKRTHSLSTPTRIKSWIPTVHPLQLRLHHRIRIPCKKTQLHMLIGWTCTSQRGKLSSLGRSMSKKSLRGSSSKQSFTLDSN
jgi:hypothetical protein